MASQHAIDRGFGNRVSYFLLVGAMDFGYDQYPASPGLLDKTTYQILLLRNRQIRPSASTPLLTN